MSTFLRYFTVACFAAGLVSAGCGTKPPTQKKAQKSGKTDGPPASDVHVPEVDIFAEEAEVSSAREASQDALGAKAVEEPKTDILKTEKVEALEIEEPKATDIEM